MNSALALIIPHLLAARCCDSYLSYGPVSVCLSVRHKSVFYRIGRTDGASWLLE